jgi:hypothetical protein
MYANVAIIKAVASVLKLVLMLVYVTHQQLENVWILAALNE